MESLEETAAFSSSNLSREELQAESAKSIYYRAVLDARANHEEGLKHDTIPHTEKPFGTLSMPKPPAPTTDAFGNPIAPPISKPTSNRAEKRVLRPNFEPNDKIDLKLVLTQRVSQPSTLEIHMTIPHEALPDSLDPTLVGRDGLTAKLYLYAANLKELKKFNLKPCFDEAGNAVEPLPFIVQNTFKLDEMKSNILKLQLKATQSENAPFLTTNLLNTLEYKEHDTNRAVQALKSLVMGESFTIDIYLRDEEKARLESTLQSLLNRMSAELKEGDVFRHFYTEKLVFNNKPHKINAGSALKPPNLRPAMTTRSPQFYRTKFEMTTRLGVGIKQVMEDTQEKVLAINATPGVVRLMEVPGAGDWQYYAFLSCSTEIRLVPGDQLSLNFRMTDNIDDENWKLRVLDNFPWMAQGEVLGLLERPREALSPDATSLEKTTIRQFQKCKLPYTLNRAKSADDARSHLEQATAIRCLVNFRPSEQSDTRLITSLQYCVQEVRPNPLQDPKQKFVESDTIKNWGDFLLMHHSCPIYNEDLFPSKIAQKYLQCFTEPDHLQAIDYLRKAPVSQQNTCLAMIVGFAGVGKSSFAAGVIVALLLQKPAARILVAASANQATDVLIRKINEALECAKNSDEEFASLLKDKTVVRVYSDTSEASYIISLAEREYDPTAQYDDDNEKHNPTEIKAGETESENSKSAESNAAEVKDEQPAEVKVDEQPAEIKGDAEPKEVQEEEDPEAQNEEDGGAKLSDDSDLEENASKRKAKKSKKAKFDEKVAEARSVRLTNYNAEGNAITISIDDLNANDHSLVFHTVPLERGAINLNDPKFPTELKDCATAIQMVRHTNVQLTPQVAGVYDKRYTIEELSTAAAALTLGNSSKDHAAWASLFEQTKREGNNLKDEQKKEFRDSTKKLLAEVKGAATIVGSTINALGTKSNKKNLGYFDYVIFDEAGQINLPEFIHAFASVDFRNAIILGDHNQIGPMSVNTDGPRGCTRELEKSLLVYLKEAHWPSVELFLNRRSAPGISKIISTVFYRNKMVDAACVNLPGSHILTAPMLAAFKDFFPENQSDVPVRYINVHGRRDMQDEVIGSWFNIDTASVIVSLIEKLILAGVVSPKDVPQITHYTAQQKAFSYAFNRLHEEFPDKGFNLIQNFTTDTFQGDDATCPFVDPVRTHDLGFTRDRGHSLVLVSRARDFLVVVANIDNLFDMRNITNVPVMKRCFNEAAKNGLVVHVRAPSEHSDGGHEELLNHRYVQARIIATEENAVTLDEFAKEEFAQEEMETGESGEGDGASSNGESGTNAEAGESWGNGDAEANVVTGDSWGNGDAGNNSW